MERNQVKKRDVLNLIIPNEVVCKNSYAFNRNQLEITTVNNFQFGSDTNITCITFNTFNVSSSTNPVLLISENIAMKELFEYIPCGTIALAGSDYNCDCVF